MPRKMIKLFISYRKKEPSRSVAAELAEKLKSEYGYEVFIDVIELMGGFEWANAIYENIRESDVLLVLLQLETADSEWVQREVDVARGANVAILPIRITEKPDEIDVKAVQEKLAIESKQFFTFSLLKPDYKKLIDTIEGLAKETRNAQKEWIALREDKWRSRSKATCNEAFATYSYGSHPCQVHLATGDIIEMQGIEVVVNSENNYMQMARIYESTTLSSVLRREGSMMNGAGIIDDTVQRELDDQIRMNSKYGIRPVKMGEVLVTHAGMPESNLAQHGMRYILHAATVRVDADFTEKMTPLNTDDGIRKVVLKCLKKIHEINKERGVISPEGTSAYLHEIQEKEHYQDIRSIIFPLFGTGHGGRSVPQVTQPILEAIRDFLVNFPDTTLAHIHVATFADPDISLVESKFKDIGFTSVGR